MQRRDSVRAVDDTKRKKLELDQEIQLSEKKLESLKQEEEKLTQMNKELTDR